MKRSFHIIFFLVILLLSVCSLAQAAAGNGQNPSVDTQIDDINQIAHDLTEQMKNIDEEEPKGDDKPHTAASPQNKMAKEELISPEQVAKHQRFVNWLTPFLQHPETPKVKIQPLEKHRTGHIGAAEVIATQDIAKGEVLFDYQLNENSIINVAAILAHSPEYSKFLEQLSQKAAEEESEDFEHSQTPELWDDQIIELFLIAQKKMGAALTTQFDAYFDIIPDLIDSPIVWSEEELNELIGSQLYLDTEEVKESIEDDYDLLFPFLSKENPELFPIKHFTLANYLWASSVVTSKSWVPDQEHLPLIPITEFFNFAKKSMVEFDYKLEEGYLRVIAKQDIEKDSFIWMNLAVLPNRQLLDYYGIVLEKNPFDYLAFGVGIDFSGEDKLAGNKKEYFHKKGLSDQAIFHVKDHNPLPKNLLYALRIYHVTMYDYDTIGNAVEGNEISKHNELKVAQTLIDFVKEKFAEYPTTPKEDKALFLGENGPLSDRLRKAVILRRGEKKILYKTLSKAKEIMAKVKKGWQFREMDLPGAGLKATPTEML